jgi:choline kinase
MIQHNIDNMMAHGIEEIIVVVGYMKELLVEHLAGYPVKFVHNPFYAITNNMASLWFAGQFLRGDFIYSHADLVYDPTILGALIDGPHDTALLVDEKQCGDEEMKVIAKDGLLVESSKLLDPALCLGEWTGIARFSHSFTQVLMGWIGALLEQGHLQDYDTLALTQLAQRGEPIHIVKFADKPWMEIDTEEDLLAARKLVGLAGS